MVRQQTYKVQGALTAKQQRGSRRRRATVALAVLAAAILALGGTFAWNNYLQHKTNAASLGGVFYRAILVENYDPSAAANWQIQDPALTKQISVLNPGPTTAQDKNTYGDVYARIQLKEFMELYPISQSLSSVRYMIDTTGAFVGFANDDFYAISLNADGYPVSTEVASGDPGALDGHDAAVAYAAAISSKIGNGTHAVEQERQFYTPIKTNSVAANPAVAAAHPDWVSTSDPTTFDPTKVVVDPINGLDDADLPWYIETEAGDPNGIYGNFMMTDANIDYADGTSLVPGVQRADEDQAANQQDPTINQQDLDAVTVGPGAAPADNDECLYTPHQWTQGMYAWDVNGPGQPTFDDYVAWSYGPDVILASQWNGQPTPKWIIDDSATNTQGWVYWGEPIAPGESTTDFLTSLTMVQQPQDRIFYTIHTDLEAVSFDELYRWDTNHDASGNTQIVTALQASGVSTTGILITSTKQLVATGTSADLTALVQGSYGVSPQVTWSLDHTDGGSEITQTSPTTATLAVGAAETNNVLTVTATSKANPAITQTYTITVTNHAVVGGITVAPSTADAFVLMPTTFTATTQYLAGSQYGTGNITWSVAGADGYTIQDANTIISPTGVLTIGPAETSGQKLTVTATCAEPGYTDKTASATVTIWPQLLATPTVATTRYITAAAAGDTSDWVEVATNGKYSLMLRRNPLPSRITGLTSSDRTYAGSKQQNAINNWFAGTTSLSTSAPLRSVIVGNTAMTNLGTVFTYNVGFSEPSGAMGATGNNTAFALSMAESYIFTGKSKEIASSINSYNDNPAGTINYNFITQSWATTNSYVLLRTYVSTEQLTVYCSKWSGDDEVANGLVSVANIYNANGFNSYAQPAVWIDTAAAQAAGLFSSR